ncbi:MAG TPA: polya polymerase, partial [Thermoanaerobaculia bacterium]
MELIATHVGADFDGFAAMMVARRLHPEARLFFPGSREGSLRRAIEARGIEVPELRQKDIDPAAITRVILCDIRQRERIGPLAEWLEANPGIEVWAYDHHPASESDVEARGGIL